MDTIAPTTPVACPVCTASSRKFGKDRKGNQRYQCPKCEKTFVVAVNPLGDMRIGVADAAKCLQMLLEGVSLRAASRLSGVNRETILNLMVLVGERCEGFLEARICGVQVADVQCDEIWSFVGCKEKTRIRRHPDQVDIGDCYCFTAIERESKLLLTWHLGTRTPEDTAYFADKLALATSGQFQVSTDGFTPYAQAIPGAMPSADFAQIIKTFSTKEDGKKDSRYSPGVVIGTVKVPRHGSPDMAKVCTSHVERHNLTLRMQNRRLTRLTNGFSKKWANHSAAFALQFAFYNFVRIHETLGMTPAMKAGLTDHVWSIEELIRTSTIASPAQK